MTLNRTYIFLWLSWFVAFGVIEALAIRDRRPGDTLSEMAWAFVSEPVLWWTSAGFLVWLTVHILSRGRWA